MIERERDWCNAVDDYIEPLGASTFDLLEIWQEINYN
jgi:hypothetical protein